MKKSDLEKLIDEKAERLVEKDLSDLFKSFRYSDFNGNGNTPITFNNKCGELAGKSLYKEFSENALFCDNYDRAADYTLLEKYTNWSEIKENLVKKYKAQITDEILKDVDSIRSLLDKREA